MKITLDIPDGYEITGLTLAPIPRFLPMATNAKRRWPTAYEELFPDTCKSAPARSYPNDDYSAGYPL